MVGFKHILGTILIAFVICSYGQPYYEWTNPLGESTGSDNANGVVVDASDNSYVTGTFRGTMDFDPGPGTFNITSTGLTDAYVAKYDPNGKLIWAKSTVSGQTSSDRADGRHITIDNQGNLIVSGSIVGSVDIDPGSGTQIQTSVGSYDWFVQKLDNQGNLIWAHSTGSTAADEIRKVAITPNNEVYATGYFAGTTDFDPGTGVFNMTPNNSGWEDAFIYKLDSSGNFLWAKSIKGTSGTYGWGVGSDTSGNAYVSGSFLGTADLNPNAGVQNETSLGANDVFLIKLTSTGAFSWAKAYGGSSNNQSRDIELDNLGNIVICGIYQGSIDLNPGTASFNVTSTGSYDLFIQKLDSSGNFIWGGSIGGVNNDFVEQIKIDTDNNVYLSGSYSGTMDFDPTGGTKNITALGTYDSFVEKLKSNGSLLWVADQRGSANDIGSGVAILGKNQLYLTGSFAGTTDFDPTTGTANFTTTGNYDGFLLKLSQCTSSSSTINPTACTSYISPSGKYTWTASNTYTDTLKNTGGCDSVITVNLTITGPSNGTDVLTACDSLQWIDGKTYYASNSTATHTLTGGAYNGCDSIVTLNLTIVKATTGTDKITACNSYKWIDGKTYTSSNNTATYTIAGGAANGCDSVVTLNLTINTVNATTTASNDTITANATGATYQWLDCDNNYAVISGATNQMFIATANGHYAVAVTQNGCTDTSACVTVTGVGIDENSLGADVKVYPNPTTGIIHIYPGKATGKITVKITSIDGKVVHQAILHNGKVNNIKLNGEVGMYIVEIKSDAGASANYRIIKK